MGSGNSIGGSQKTTLVTTSPDLSKNNSTGQPGGTWGQYQCVIHTPVVQYLPLYSQVTNTYVTNRPLNERNLSVPPLNGVVRLLPGQAVTFSDGTHVKNETSGLVETYQNGFYQFTGYAQQQRENMSHKISAQQDVASAETNISGASSHADVGTASTQTDRITLNAFGLIDGDADISKMTEEQWQEVKSELVDIWQQGCFSAETFDSRLEHFREKYQTNSYNTLHQKLSQAVILSEKESDPAGKDYTMESMDSSVTEQHLSPDHAQMQQPELGTDSVSEENSSAVQVPEPPPLPGIVQDIKAEKQVSGTKNVSVQTTPLAPEEEIFITQLNDVIVKQNGQNAKGAAQKKYVQFAEIRASDKMSDARQAAPFLSALKSGFRLFKSQNSLYSSDPQKFELLYKGIAAKYQGKGKFTKTTVSDAGFARVNQIRRQKYEKLIGLKLEQIDYSTLNNHRQVMLNLSHAIMNAENAEGEGAVQIGNYVKTLKNTPLVSISRDYFVKARSEATLANEIQADQFENKMSDKIADFIQQHGEQVVFSHFWDSLSGAEKTQFRQYAQNRYREIDRAFSYARDEKIALKIRGWPVR